MRKPVSLLVIVAFITITIIGIPLVEASHEHHVPSDSSGGPGLFALGLGFIAGTATAILTGNRWAGAAAGVGGLVLGSGIEGFTRSSAAAKGITHCDAHVRSAMGRVVIHDEDCVSTTTRPGYMGTVRHAPAPPAVIYRPDTVIMNPYPDAQTLPPPAPQSTAPPLRPAHPEARPDTQGT